MFTGLYARQILTDHLDWLIKEAQATSRREDAEAIYNQAFGAVYGYILLQHEEDLEQSYEVNNAWFNHYKPIFDEIRYSR